MQLPLISSNYLVTAPTLANVLLYLLVIVKLPRGIFQRLLRHAKPASEPQRTYPVLLFVTRTLYYLKRAYNHLTSLDFSVLQGSWGYRLWKLGILGAHHRKQLRKIEKKLQRPLPRRMPQGNA